MTLPRSDKRKLAVFDMDETLIHCLGSQRIEDKTRKVNERGIELCSQNADVVLKGIGYAKSEKRHQFVNIRPYALECLREVQKNY